MGEEIDGNEDDKGRDRNEDDRREKWVKEVKGE
jgi:hypothetical protein